MPKNLTVTGIDIGNSRIKVVIAKINQQTGRPEIIGASSVSSNGLRKGMVVDMEETVQNINSAVQQAVAMSGASVKRAYLSINGVHIHSQVSRGVIAVSRADNEISQGDIDRVLQAASVVSLPPNREIIHVIPRNFIVDGTEYIKNPLGMKGVRLEADVFIIDGLSPHIRNLAKCVNGCGIEVAGIVYAPLAAATSSLDKNQKEYGVVSLDLGGGTSSLTVFQEADLVHNALFPIGSKHITADLAIALRTSIDLAEKVKLTYACTSEAIDLRSRAILDLSEAINEESYLMPQKQLIRVIDARAHELLDLVGQELKKISQNGMLPAGIVLSGGGANLPGLALLVKEKLRLPVKVAKPIHVDGVLDVAHDPSFAVPIGLVLWGLEQEGSGDERSKFNISLGKNFMATTLRWLKNFMP